jgi:formamidopyrimidine-DNA glycosylase
MTYVFEFFRGKNKDIKSFLLDQKFVSGIGNIYASEILFLCKINPCKKVSVLSKKECQKIILNSKKILLKAIAKGGSSIRDFKDTSGSKGGFQNEFKVYQQEGEKCKNLGCFDLIKKKIIGNRSTFFCDSCQK